MAASHTDLSEREARLGEVLAALLEAAERGETPERADWLARHPEFAAELNEFFDSEQRLRSLAAPLRAALSPNTPAHSATLAVGDAAMERAGQCFGDTEVLEELGRGGMGVVFKARQKGANRVVALKVLRPDPLGPEEQTRRFRNEAEIVAQLDHPNIVPLYEVGEHAGRVYFSMKLLEGGSLAGQLPRFADDPRGAAGVMAAVARAVHHAHQRGVLHRDLKPSNILLDREGRPYVTDFGLARRVQADSELTAAAGPAAAGVTRFHTSASAVLNPQAGRTLRRPQLQASGALPAGEGKRFAEARACRPPQRLCRAARARRPTVLSLRPDQLPLDPVEFRRVELFPGLTGQVDRLGDGSESFAETPRRTKRVGQERQIIRCVDDRPGGPPGGQPPPDIGDPFRQRSLLGHSLPAEDGCPGRPEQEPMFLRQPQQLFGAGAASRRPAAPLVENRREEQCQRQAVRVAHLPSQGDRLPAHGQRPTRVAEQPQPVCPERQACHLRVLAVQRDVGALLVGGVKGGHLLQVAAGSGQLSAEQLDHPECVVGPVEDHRILNLLAQLEELFGDFQRRPVRCSHGGERPQPQENRAQVRTRRHLSA
jgi:tRNA A-37 threonylcarbamoyl transferase component Bud32